MKVAIQGIAGSYHHQVATEMYGQVDFLECINFDELVEAVSKETVDLGIMAIGNSIAGSILPNYLRIVENDLFIIGERYLSIEHQLTSLANQQIAEIKEVQSHPMALLQCKSFFRDFPHIKLVETDDTAAAAELIAREKKKGVAAIASAQAAALYGLHVLEKDIQQVKQNATRFVILNKEIQDKNIADKATIHFTANHEPGSLARILTTLGNLGINVSKILSIPVIERPFVFSFVADIEFDSLKQFHEAQLEIGILVESITILGIYKSHKV